MDSDEEGVMIRQVVLRQVATMDGERLMIHLCGDKNVQAIVGMLELAKYRLVFEHEREDL